MNVLESHVNNHIYKDFEAVLIQKSGTMSPKHIAHLLNSLIVFQPRGGFGSVVRTALLKGFERTVSSMTQRDISMALHGYEFILTANFD